MRIYDFASQLAKGEEAERMLDRHFDRWFVIERASAVDQQRGIDRWFTARHSGQRFSVEYKTDWRATMSGNAFIEIETPAMVVGAYTGHGWAYDSEAKWLFYCVPNTDEAKVYVLLFARLRQELPQWLNRYPQRTIANKRYGGTGLLVPLRELASISHQVASL